MLTEAEYQDALKVISAYMDIVDLNPKHALGKTFMDVVALVEEYEQANFPDLAAPKDAT